MSAGIPAVGMANTTLRSLGLVGLCSLMLPSPRVRKLLHLPSVHQLCFSAAEPSRMSHAGFFVSVLTSNKLPRNTLLVSRLLCSARSSMIPRYSRPTHIRSPSMLEAEHSLDGDNVSAGFESLSAQDARIDINFSDALHASIKSRSWILRSKPARRW